ncbi:MAG TPA: hypothetical protein VK588_13110 [Chitinophagaceae bacterium]|nr:hypothetical protein [Chitinophagaceae bacterium]
MKKITVFTFLFASLTVSAQNNIAEDTTAKPAITAFGKSDGEKIEMKIGKDGGSIISPDGKIKLIVPEGAVSKKTIFSIQPTKNLMPNGIGKSYQMEPAGINFQQPLQIIFYYTDPETKGNSPELLAIAMQDDKGQWLSPTKVTTDTVAKTLTAEILHFSSYVLYECATIYPESARVKVNGSIRLKILGIVNYTGGEVYDENHKEIPLKVRTESAEIWSVNGIPKGNSTTGLISASQDYTAIFQAPAKVPSQNPAAVSVQERFFENNAYAGRWHVIKLVSNITIYDGDAYEVKMESVIKSGDKYAWGGIRTATDKGSFIVSLEDNKPTLINIVNNLEVMTNDCKNKILNPTTCTGLLHVAGIKDFKITPANPPGQPYPTVEISFVPFPIEFSKAQFLCPPPPGSGDPGGSSGNDLAGLSKNFGRALPWDIKFLAKDGEQIIINSSGEEGSLRIWVQKIKDD